MANRDNRRRRRSSSGLLLFLLVWCMMLLLLASCGTGRRLQEYQRDSVAVIIRDSIRFRDSLLLVPVPEGSDKARLPDTDTSFLQTMVAESEAFVKDGILHHSLRNRGEMLIPIRVTIPERLHSEERGLIRYLKTVERVEVEKELSKWQRFLQGVGWTVLIAGALWLAWKLSKIVKI